MESHVGVKIHSLCLINSNLDLAIKIERDLTLSNVAGKTTATHIVGLNLLLFIVVVVPPTALVAINKSQVIYSRKIFTPLKRRRWEIKPRNESV